MDNQNKSFEKFINFSPILTSDNDWDRFDALSDKIKDKLSTCSEKIEKISSFFNLSPQQASSISLAVRKFYLGDLSEKNIPGFIQTYSDIDAWTAQKISEVITQKIINDDSFEKAYQSKVDELPIREALKKYPEIGEQLITEKRISLKSFPEKVRPSIKNWLSDYSFNLGYGTHNSIQRGRYLFQSLNTHSLNNSEKEILSFVLGAFDENLKVAIDKESHKLIFDVSKELKNIQKTTRPVQPWERPTPEKTEDQVLNIQKTQFDFPQKMSFEKSKVNHESNNQEKQITLKQNGPLVITRPQDRFTQMKNVINLKDSQ